MLIINGKIFTGKLTAEKHKQIVIEILKLRQPKVLAMDKVKIEEKDITIVLQREIGIINQLATLESPEYLGSKHFNECILVYLHTETDHAIVHVDKHVKPDFFSVIQQFNDQENISICLAGGIVGQSEEILKNIIESLCIASERNIRITINSQKIMRNNQQTDPYQQIYDNVRTKANVLYRHLYNETLDKKFLDSKKISEFYVDKPINDDELRKMVTALCGINLNPCKMKITLPFISSLDKKYFLELLDGVFSQTGFYYCDLTFTKNGLYDQITLKNFAIHLKTGNIHIIPDDISTPNQYGRLLALTDAHAPSHFFCAYNNKNGEYSKPTYSLIFANHLNTLKSMISSPVFHISHLFDLFNRIDTALCAHYMHLYLVNEANITNGCNKSFHSYKKYFLIHSHENLEMITKNINQHLNVLNKITGGKFEAKKRKNPEYTIDTFLLCNSEKHSDEICKKINAQGIHSIQIEDNNNFYVCVPAINVKKYSDRIINVYNKFFTNLKNNMRLFLLATRNDQQSPLNKLPKECVENIIRFGMRD